MHFKQQMEGLGEWVRVVWRAGVEQGDALLKKCSLFLGILWVSCSAFGAQMVGVRGAWVEANRVVFELTGKSNYKAFSLKKPDRIVLDLSQTELKTDLSHVSLANTPVSNIRVGKLPSGVRVVLDMKQALKFKAFLMRSNRDGSYRLVVDWKIRNIVSHDISLSKGGMRGIYRIPERHTLTMSKPKRRDVVVVIDPGHGGHDPGTMGKRGVREKDVTLKIAKKLYRLIDQQPGIRAVLTRGQDKFISLRGRMNMARRGQADVFIAIHADAFRNSRANGVSVYALSSRGASSEAARWLAESENKSESLSLGGIDLSSTDHLLGSVLLDLAQTASIRSSLQLGNDILRSMKNVTKLHRRHVEQAGFVVLKSPDIPSILVETGFLSNPAEAQKLSSEFYQDKIAYALYAGIKQYIVRKPPYGTWAAAE